MVNKLTYYLFQMKPDKAEGASVLPIFLFLLQTTEWTLHTGDINAEDISFYYSVICTNYNS